MKIGASSDVGLKRETNQDNYLILDDKITLGIVADGMGGHNGGEIASKMAVEIISNKLLEGQFKNESEISKAIKESIESANTNIYLESVKNEKLKGMGTTVTLAYIIGDKLYIGHVGDSRAYIIRDNEMNQITWDHSYVNELIKSGSITREEAKNHPKKNVITRAVGTSSILEVDLYWENIGKDDIILLCSDGLTNMVEEEDILSVFKNNYSMENSCNILINMANNRGGKDNITIVAMKMINEVKIW